MPCIICFTAIIFNIILILFSVYIFCQTKIAATHCAAASCGLRPLLYALFCNKLTLERYQEILATEAQGMKRLPELHKQIATLEKQLTALTSETIDSRLKRIEEAIRVGQ